MEFDRYLRELQELLGYHFKDPNLLALALTAAGYEGNDKGSDDEQTKYDGNRRLAQYGDSLLQTIILEKNLFEEENPARQRANEALKSAAVREHRVERAKRFKIHDNMKLNIRQKGQASPKTLSTAINAIFGACYRDSRDILTVRRVIERFGLGVDDDFYTDPATIRDQEYISIAQLTEGVFVPDLSLRSSAHTLSPEAIEMTLIQTSNLALDAHPISALEESDYGDIIQEMDGYFGPLPESQGSIFNNSYEDSINEDREFEIAWDVDRNPSISLIGHAESSATTLSDSGTVIESVEESSSKNRESPSARTSNLVLSNHDRNKRLRSEGSPGQTERQPFARGLNRRIRGGKLERGKHLAQEKTKAGQLDAYVSRQKEYCQARELPCPEEAFTAMIISANKSIKLQERITDLKILYFAIASPESVVTLQTVVMVGRRDNLGPFRVPNWKLSVSERVATIERLEKDMTYMAFIRRCHIHQLYVDSSAESRKTSDGFVMSTAESMSSRSSPAIGNPNHLEDARVLTMIMHEVYPDLKESDSTYKTKLANARKLRKLGQRLDFLVKIWGYGILGLLPFAKDMPDVDPVLDITDSFILSIPEDIFKWFIQCFNQSYGGHISQISEAASQIVVAISRGALDPLSRFEIENMEREDILKEPRGSQAIILSLSRTSPVLS